MNWESFDKRAGELRLLNLIVYRDGRELLRRDYEEEIRRNQYSVSKSVTSVGMGIAQREGLLSLNERLVDAFPEDLPKVPGEFLEEATVRDLLTMSLGQEGAELMGEQKVLLRERDWVKYILAKPLVNRPGTKFLYSNAGPYLAGVLLQRRAGCDLIHYLMPRLFAPLGIPPVTWEMDYMGYTFGASGLFLGVSELAIFGELLLQDGMWNGRQLVPAEYLKEAASKQIENGGEGYGYLFWRGERNSFRADGKYGQFAIAFPDDHLLIAANAECREQEKLLKLLTEYEPAFFKERAQN